MLFQCLSLNPVSVFFFLFFFPFFIVRFTILNALTYNSIISPNTVNNFEVVDSHGAKL